MTSTAEKPTTQIECARDGDVATILFSSETGVNVFSSAAVGTIGTHVRSIAVDAGVRFVVLRGKGKTFVAGADIAQMSHFDEEDGRVFSKTGHHVFDEIAQLPQVTFAAINGHALGGGCEIALACDFRIMVESAKIGLPESRLGLVPGWGGTQRLARLVGPSHARRLMYSGEGISANEALRIGLVDELVPNANALDATLQRWQQTMKPGSPSAIRRIKHAMLHGDEINQFGLGFSCSDAREGMAAFLEKRSPAWAK